MDVRYQCISFTDTSQDKEKDEWEADLMLKDHDEPMYEIDDWQYNNTIWTHNI